MDRPEKKHLARTPLGTFLIVVGLLCLVTAGGFGSWQTVRVPRTGDATAEAPNVTGAGAACGFAIAGGLCFSRMNVLADRCSSPFVEVSNFRVSSRVREPLARIGMFGPGCTNRCAKSAAKRLWEIARSASLRPTRAGRFQSLDSTPPRHTFTPSLKDRRCPIPAGSAA